VNRLQIKSATLFRVIIRLLSASSTANAEFAAVTSALLDGERSRARRASRRSPDAVAGVIDGGDQSCR